LDIGEELEEFYLKRALSFSQFLPWSRIKEFHA
jgi:hypothetical protein